MRDEHETLGGRLPLREPATLSPPEREVYDTVMATWVRSTQAVGTQAVTGQGQLIGPFNAFLLHPQLSSRILELASALSSGTDLSDGVREVVIVGVGAYWGADYELYAHTAFARDAGVPADAVRTLLAGGLPDDLHDEQMLAARLTADLVTRHRIDGELYLQAEHTFGRRGLFDIAALIGLYHTVCTILNLFDVPAPPERTPATTTFQRTSP